MQYLSFYSSIEEAQSFLDGYQAASDEPLLERSTNDLIYKDYTIKIESKKGAYLIVRKWMVE